MAGSFMFKLREHSTVIGCFRPPLLAYRQTSGHCCDEGACGRIPHRVVIFRSPVGVSRIALCGLHFVEACNTYPELKPFEGASGVLDS